MPKSVREGRITREAVIAEDEIDVFLSLYREAFRIMEELSPLRQSMTDEEFRDEMRNPAVIKLVGWDTSGSPAAILCTTNDISCIPWLNPKYYQKMYPSQFAAGSLFWVGTILVHPFRKGQHHVSGLIRENVLLVTEGAEDGICLFDCCEYNATEIKLPELVEAVSREVDPSISCEQIDTQRFYAIRRVAS